jgi:hypothetical protein
MSSGYKSKRHKGKERERDKEKERQGNQVPYSTVDDGPQWSQWCWSDEYKGYYRSRDGSNGELEYDWDNRTNVASSESQHQSSSPNYTTETPRAYEPNDPNVYALNTAISALDVSSNTRRTDQSSGYSSAMMYAPGTNITPGRQETYQSSFYSSITESSSRQEDYPSSASFSPNIYGQGPASGPATAYVPPSPSVPAAGGSYSGPIAQVYQSPMAYETEAGVGTSYGQGGDSDPGPYTSQTYPQNYQQSSQPLPPIWLPHPINPPCECDKNKLCGVLIWPKPPNDPENGNGRIEGPDGSKAACVSESDKLATVSTMVRICIYWNFWDTVEHLITYKHRDQMAGACLYGFLELLLHRNPGSLETDVPGSTQMMNVTTNDGKKDMTNGSISLVLAGGDISTVTESGYLEELQGCPGNRTLSGKKLMAVLHRILSAIMKRKSGMKSVYYS